MRTVTFTENQFATICEALSDAINDQIRIRDQCRVTIASAPCSPDVLDALNNQIKACDANQKRFEEALRTVEIKA